MPLIGLTVSLGAEQYHHAAPCKLDDLAETLNRVEGRIAESLARSQQARRIAEAKRRGAALITANRRFAVLPR